MGHNADEARLCPETLEKFVETYRRSGRLDVASAAVGCSTTTTWKWRNRSKADPRDDRYHLVDPLGEEPPVTLWDACERAFREFLKSGAEAKLVELATGYDDPVVYQGRVMYEADTSARPTLDPDTGLYVYPPKVDPLTGEPVPLTVRKVNPASLHFLLEKRDPDYADRKQVDVTSGGRPLVIPGKATTEELLAAHGAGVVDGKKNNA